MGEAQGPKPPGGSADGGRHARYSLHTSLNLAPPVLRVSPSFGDGMFMHVAGDDTASARVRTVGDSLERFARDGLLRSRVEWRGFECSVDSCVAHLVVRGLGRRPANTVLVQTQARLAQGGGEALPAMGLDWRVQAGISSAGSNGDDRPPDRAPFAYPEYLLELTISHPRDPEAALVRRTLHVIPPVTHLQFDVRHVLFSPELSFSPIERSVAGGQPAAPPSPASPDAAAIPHSAAAPPDAPAAATPEAPRPPQRRRGFGLELETVQLPPDPDATQLFSNAEQFADTLRRLRPVETDPDTGTCTTQGWDQLSNWVVCSDPQVCNATELARMDLYRRCEAAMSNSSMPGKVAGLILGGDGKLVDHPAFPGYERTHLASPEYNSPAPPNELYYEFGPSASARTKARGVAAERQIRLLLERVIKSPDGAHHVMCSTVSDIGQSTTSIHVHVNVRSPTAWPRETISGPHADIESTRFVLSVLCNWVRFDGVIRTFCKPWMWRERSLAPMFATGPEFLHHETAWTQGTSVLIPEEAAAQKIYHVPKLFRHLFTAYRKAMLGERAGDARAPEGAEGGSGSERNGPAQDDAATPPPSDGEGSLFDRVFDYQTIYDTVFRNNSLNLLSLRKYVAPPPPPPSSRAPPALVPHLSVSRAPDPTHQQRRHRHGRLVDRRCNVCFCVTVSEPCSTPVDLGFNITVHHRYGTVEFRRMHATLDADSVACWTKFCVSFVQLFGEDYARHGRCFFEGVEDWETCGWEAGLDRLIQAQNEATMEELLEVMAHPVTGYLTPTDFEVLRSQ